MENVVLFDWLDTSADIGDDEGVVTSALFEEREDVLIPSVLSAGEVTALVELSLVMTEGMLVSTLVLLEDGVTLLEVVTPSVVFLDVTVEAASLAVVWIVTWLVS